MTTLLPISLQKSVYEIIDQSNLRGAAVRAILLSTTEGVPLGRVVVQSTDDDHPMKVDVLASIESVWAPASKQFPVLGLDKLKQVTAMYNHGTLIHIYQAPMVRLCSVLLGVGCGVWGVGCFGANGPLDSTDDAKQISSAPFFYLFLLNSFRSSQYFAVRIPILVRFVRRRYHH